MTILKPNHLYFTPKKKNSKEKTSLLRLHHVTTEANRLPGSTTGLGMSQNGVFVS